MEQILITKSADTNFNPLSQRFEKNIYHTAKGRIRLAVLKQILSQRLELQKSSLKIIDCGAGQGNISLWLAAQGHSVQGFDLSEELLDIFQREATIRSLDHLISLDTCSLQQIPSTFNQKADLLICHAVLEWMDQPKVAFQHFYRLLKPGGILSLMFYNVESIILRNALRGNFRKIESGHFSGEAGSLTPINPLVKASVLNELICHNFIVESSHGVRSFFDHMNSDVQQKRKDEDIVRLELQLANREPYLSMSRYIHVFARKPS